ncbi:MAG: hypothetical protein RIT45_3856 [Pseudomonadota bacterium]|jgi:hypothetical protein
MRQSPPQNAPSATSGDAPSRRGFLSRLFAGASAVVGGGMLSGFGGSQRGRMYGPVRPAASALARPLAHDAARLLGPYADGRVLERAWAVAHVTHGDAGQLVVVLADGETTGHAELELWARGTDVAGSLATTRQYAIHLPGTPTGQAPPHIERVAARVAAVVRRQEAAVQLRQPLPGRAPTDVA